MEGQRPRLWPDSGNTRTRLRSCPGKIWLSHCCCQSQDLRPLRSAVAFKPVAQVPQGPPSLRQCSKTVLSPCYDWLLCFASTEEESGPGKASIVGGGALPLTRRGWPPGKKSLQVLGSRRSSSSPCHLGENSRKVRPS